MAYDKAMEEGLRFAAKRMKEAEKQLSLNDREGAKALLVDAYGVVSKLSPTMETTAEFASYYRDLGRGFAFVGDQAMSDKCLGLAKILQPEGPALPTAARTPDAAPAAPAPTPLTSATSDALRTEIESVRQDRARLEAQRKELDRREQALGSKEEVLGAREKRLAEEATRLEAARREVEDRRRELEMKEIELAEARRRLREPPGPDTV
jgi:hypothetical protein